MMIVRKVRKDGRVAKGRASRAPETGCTGVRQVKSDTGDFERVKSE